LRRPRRARLRAARDRGACGGGERLQGRRRPEGRSDRPARSIERKGWGEEGERGEAAGKKGKEMRRGGRNAEGVDGDGVLSRP